VLLCFLCNYKVTKNFSHMQVFLILFSIYFAHNQPLILNPYIELTLITELHNFGVHKQGKGAKIFAFTP
ncbi:MAG: hypothetical protein II952_06595, partial [Paludibacteraceae bacterium]|nr:hypothetical protein [Paludibacteraceae bacterium]